MADGDKTALIVSEFLGAAKDGPRHGIEEARGNAIASPADYTDQNVCPPLHRMHERRLVQNAGRMVIGVTMPAPPMIETQAARIAGPDTPVFYSNDAHRGGVSRTALAVACAVALGGTAVLSGKFTSQEGAHPSHGVPGRDVTSDTTSALPVGKPVQLLTMSDAQAGNVKMAALSPAVVADRPHAPESGFTRVAQKDSQGLGAQDVFGPAGTPIRLPISLNGARPEDYSFLMFRGLPPEVTLSAGFRLKESWAVSLRDIENLSIETPAQFQGEFKLEILLIKGRDTPAESRLISVEIVPADIQIPPSAAITQPAPGPQVLTAAPRTIEPVERAAPPERPAPPAVVSRPAPSASQPAGLSPQQEDAMMKRAAGLLANKDVMSARLLLEHLANSGNASAALAMGKTFDPSFLQSIGAASLKPDVAKARQWYRRAGELGDPEASSRLKALASR